MSEETDEPQIRVGYIRTEAIKGGNDERVYNLGGAKGVNLTAIPFLRNGLPVKEAGIALAIYIIWSAPLYLLGIGPTDFQKFALLLHFGPPVIFIRWIFKQAKESTLSTWQQLGFTLGRFFREHTRYQGNAPAGHRGTIRIRFTMLTAPGATSLPEITKAAYAQQEEDVSQDLAA